MNDSRNLSIFAAFLLSIFVLCLVLLAVFDAHFFCIPWQETVAKFQTFLGGLSVLAASLFAYHVNTAMVQEVCRKNDADEKNLKTNILIKAALAAEMIRQQSHSRLHDIKTNSNNYKNPKITRSEYENLRMTMPTQWLEIWNHLAFFPIELHPEIAKITNVISIHISEHALKVTQNDREIMSIKEVMEKLGDIGEKNPLAAQPENAKKLQGALELINKKYFDLHLQLWERDAGMLESINRSALIIMKSLPLSKEWSPDVGPYPPKMENTTS